MSEIRASACAIYADDEHGNPLLVARDEQGVLRPVERLVPVDADVVFVSCNLKGRGNVLILEPKG